MAGNRQWVREIVGGSSYCAAHDLRVLFGLGSFEKIDKVDVHWPSGASTHLENLPARSYVSITEPGRKSEGSAPKGQGS